MDRVAALVQAHDYRQALVRLWVLASDPARLNEWEQARGGKSRFEATVTRFEREIAGEGALSAEDMRTAPLALVRALDAFIAAHRQPDMDAAHVHGHHLAFHEDGQRYWLVPVTQQARREVPLAKQVGNRHAWFQHHAVLPTTTSHGIHVSVTVSEDILDATFAKLRAQESGTLKVWIAHFTDGADVQWDRETSASRNWRTTHIAPTDVRRESILQAVQHASEAGAHVLVFPEFTVDLEHRRALEAHLQRRESSCLALLVTGSFHEPVPQGQTRTAYNTAPVYDATGESLFSHQKLRIFGELDNGAEHVELGRKLHVLVTPVGCMTVLICKDFMDEHESVRTLLSEVPVDWVFVPSFGNASTLRAHKARAKSLANVTVGTNTVVAQTQNSAMAPAGKPLQHLPGFGHGAGAKESSDVGESGGAVMFPMRKQEPPGTAKGKPPLRLVP